MNSKKISWHGKRVELRSKHRRGATRMNIQQGYVADCFFCGFRDFLTLKQCQNHSSAIAEFTAQGWAHEEIHHKAGLACPDCRTVTGHLKLVLEA